MDEETETTVVGFLKTHQKTKKSKTVDLNKIYLDTCSKYIQPMEDKYATKIH